MFAVIFRGIVLVAVISWYSTSVWKMIDVYFKNRFDNYLRAEYDKNPHMLADIEAYRATAGKENPVVQIPKEEEARLNEVVKTCSADVCLVSNEDDSELGEPIPPDDKLTLSDPIEISQPETTATPTDSPEITDENEIIKLVEKSPKASIEQLKNDSAKRGNVLKKKPPHHKIPPSKVQEEKSIKKKRLRTITFTEKDFQSTRIKVTPQDFAEFDIDEDALQDNEHELNSILVSDLHFKPKADIGDLRKVSPEEFCPLTLEDEFSCDETKTWP